MMDGLTVKFCSSYKDTRPRISRRVMDANCVHLTSYTHLCMHEWNTVPFSEYKGNKF